MNAHTHTGSLWSRFVFNAAVVGIGLLGCWQAAHAATAANTNITNTATVSYIDGNNLPQTDQSNTVTTTVQSVYAVDIEAATTKTIGPDGGTLYYAHTITNTGNNAAGFDVTVVDDAGNLVLGGFVVYKDVNNNGTYEAGTDTVLPITNGAGLYDTGSLGINTGVDDVIKVLVEVVVPASTTEEDSTFTVTVTGQAPAAAATDNVIDTVKTARLLFEKKQALDADCDGDISDETVTTFGTGNITTGAVPGACIRYEITLNNDTNQAVTAAVVSDNIPTYTTLNCGTGDTVVPEAQGGTVKPNIDSIPSCGAAPPGPVKTVAAALPAAGTIILTFGVKID